jgi:hypothetical protein
VGCKISKKEEKIYLYGTRFSDAQKTTTTAKTNNLSDARNLDL